MVCWQLLNSSRSPLVALTQLKKICDHPRLLSLRQCHKLGLNLGDDGSVLRGVAARDRTSTCARVFHIFVKIRVG